MMEQTSLEEYFLDQVRDGLEPEAKRLGAPDPGNFVVRLGLTEARASVPGVAWNAFFADGIRVDGWISLACDRFIVGDQTTWDGPINDCQA